MATVLCFPEVISSKHEAANYCYHVADHRQCGHAFMDGHPSLACDECRAECVHCGERIAYQGGRDESVSGIVLCKPCASYCSCCSRDIEGKMFVAYVEPEYTSHRQIIPFCKPCWLRIEADVAEQEYFN